jgi:hypothetical protein
MIYLAFYIVGLLAHVLWALISVLDLHLVSSFKNKNIWMVFIFAVPLIGTGIYHIAKIKRKPVYQR